MPSSTEYLVVFSLVLVASLVVIYLLSSLPTEVPLIKESQTYWASTYPLAIEDVKFASQYGGTMQLRVRNKSGKTLIIPQWGVYLDDYPNGVGPSSDVRVNPFSYKDIIVWPIESVFGKCDNETMFEFKLKLTYRYVDSSTLHSFVGSVPLRGRCNYAWVP